MNKLEATGKKMEKLGCLLTMLFTIPIILMIFFGPVGLGIGVIVAILGIVGYIQKGKEEKQKEET